MRKGWKNDPAWRTYHDNKQAERLRRQLQALEMAFRSEQLTANLDAALRMSRRALPTGEDVDKPWRWRFKQACGRS
jgi:hypothetical protein